MKKLGLITLITLAIDQITKLIIVANLKITDTISIIPNFFRITYLQNKGGAFSILADHILVLLLFTVIFLFIFYRIIKNKQNWNLLSLLTYGTLLGGIIGNFLDRLRLGYVIDFLDFNIGSYHYPVFNIADMCIVISCIVLIIVNIKDGDTNGDKSQTK